MSLRLSALSLIALPALIALATPTTALHEDDPKVLDRQPAYRGAGFRAAELRQAAQSGSGSMADVAMGGGFNSNGVALLSWLPLGDLSPSASSGADCWGYTSTSGREYAIITTSDSTCFVEVSDPSNAQLISRQSGPTSLWRDVKTYQNYAYSVSEGGGGIQVFNLANIDNGVVTLVNTITSGPGTSASHNVAIDEESGFLYRTGGDFYGLRIYSLANPASPNYVGVWDTKYVHDAQIVTYTSGPYAGRQIAYVCSGFNGGFTSTGVDVLDVTNKNNIQILGNETWSGAAYSHQAWLTPDRQYLYVNDELDEQGSFNTKTVVMDVSNINNPTVVNTFFSSTRAVGHNLYTKDNLLFEANYRSGMQVFDTSDPVNPQLVADFDTYPDDDDAEFNGLWSIYPYFESGIVIGSDLERGLFVWFVGDEQLEFSFPTGLPDLASPGGLSFPTQISAPTAASLVPGSAKLVYDAGEGMSQVDLVDLGGGQFEVPLPPVSCGQEIEFYLTAESSSGLDWFSPGPGESYSLVSAESTAVLASYDMQQTAGWSSGAVGDDATTGIWERGNPIGTGSQPENDNSGVGTNCWFTGQGPSGGGLGDNDIDNGKTTLLSPIFDVSNDPNARISYFRWYSNNGNSSVDDAFEIDVTSNGSTWVRVETLGPTGDGTIGGWEPSSFRIADFVTPSANVQVRFVARDEGSGSIVEAAIDDVELTSPMCGPLVSDRTTVSVGTGGTQELSLDAGPALAGKPYYLFGSLAGTTPGIALNGLNLPLNADNYFLKTLNQPNTAPLLGSFGFLDGQGAGSATFTLPGGLVPQLAGQTAHHAFLTIDVGAFLVDFVSNAVPVVLIP